MDPAGALLARAWRLYKSRFGLLVGILAVPFIAMGAGAIMARGGFPEGTYGLILMIAGTVALIFAENAAMVAVAKGTDFAASYRRGAALFFPMLWIWVLVGLAVCGSFVMLIVPGIMVMIWLLLATFILVVEDRHGFGALLASREYVRGYWWATFGRYLLLLVFGAAIGVIDLVMTATLGAVAGMAVYYLLILFFQPFAIAYLYQLYENFAGLKPEVRGAQPKGGKGFLITSMVVGLIVPFVFVAALYAVSRAVPAMVNGYLQEHAVMGQGSTVPLGDASSPLGALSVTLPQGFEMEALGQDQVLIQPTPTPSQPLGSALVTVNAVSASVPDYAKAVEAAFTNSRIPYIEHSATFLGYPAMDIIVSISGRSATTTVFAAGGHTFGVTMTESDAQDASSTAADAGVETVIASMAYRAN